MFRQYYKKIIIHPKKKNIKIFSLLRFSLGIFFKRVDFYWLIYSFLSLFNFCFLFDSIARLKVLALHIRPQVFPGTHRLVHFLPRRDCKVDFGGQSLKGLLHTHIDTQIHIYKPSGKWCFGGCFLATWRYTCALHFARPFFMLPSTTPLYALCKVDWNRRNK